METKEEKSSISELLNLITEIQSERNTKKFKYIQKLRKKTGKFLIYGTDGKTIITL